MLSFLSYHLLLQEFEFEIAGRVTTNMSRHLERKHPKLYAELKTKEKTMKEDAAASTQSRPVFGGKKRIIPGDHRQPSIASLLKIQKYTSGNPKQRKATKRLVFFLGTSRYPHRLF